MEITKDYLESLVTTNINISRSVSSLEKILDEQLLENTTLYGKIETIMLRTLGSE